MKPYAVYLCIMTIADNPAYGIVGIDCVIITTWSCFMIKIIVDVKNLVHYCLMGVHVYPCCS